MSGYATDDEQVEAIKDWWKANGTTLLAGILVVSVSWFGWTYWKNTQIANATMGSSTFEALQISKVQGDFGEVAREGLRLIAEQPRSAYSIGSAFLLAKFYIEKDEPHRAMEQFTWIIENSKDDSIKFVAVLRKVSLHTQIGSFSDAKTYLNSVDQLTLISSEQAQLDYAMAEVLLAKGEPLKAAEFLTKVVENTGASSGLLALASLQLDDVIAY